MNLTRSIENRAEEIAEESNNAAKKISSINDFSNLALKLYGWYIKNGHARSEKEEATIKKIFSAGLPENFSTANSFYEKLYLYQSHCWRAFICQDF